jgi:L-2-hydroxycarboxylate dehydrogenase (NAD+)
VFEALKLPPEDARLVGRALVKSNLRGQDGHGVARITVYSKRLRAGIVNPTPAIRITPTSPCSALCDGDNGMGFVVATRAMATAISLARDMGVGLVGVKDSTHFGASSYYVQQALDAGMISLVFTTSSPALPPHGAARAFLGAAPLAAGVPAGEEPPFLLDMSCTVIARGKLRLAAQRGEPIPPGVGLDSQVGYRCTSIVCSTPSRDVIL